MKISTKISTLVLICLLLGVGSCSRVDDFQSGGKLLEVNVQMATLSPMPMLTRGATASPIISDTVDMGNDLVMVASSQPRQTEEALTRGTPMKSAANLPSMNVKVYNSGTGAFSGSTALTATLKGTNSGGAWALSPAYEITDRNTYMAYCPIESGSNGIAVAADGRTLTYTAPTAVANQPDLCSATIVKDNVSSKLSLAMQHRLTAVGIKVSADNVTINEIKINNINNSGVLDLETGGWSGLTGAANFSPTFTTTPATAGNMNDITAANGYLMLPPQSFTNDNQTITVKYTYTGGTQETATVKLKDLTGGKWEAGQLVMYEIQLKAKFSLTLTPASLTLGAIAGTASFTYSTNSPSTTDPQFTPDGNTWITNVRVDRPTKTVTFNYAATTIEGSRSAAIRGTSGFTTTDIGLTQSLNLSISPTRGSTIAVAGGSATVKVTASIGVEWSVEVSDCTASPTSGTGTGSEQAVTLTIPANKVPQREVSATFKVTSPSIAKTWTATQEGTPYIEINGIKWANGSLVANGANGARIGAPTDYGLYFKFGSLVGWASGANGDGTGVGQPALAIKVKPTGYTGGTTWNGCGYSSGTIPASNASRGIGDPCRFYLGSPWRLPTQAEFQTSLCNGYAGGPVISSTNAAWQVSPAGMNFNNNSTKLFIPASGLRSTNGVLSISGDNAYYWSESTYSTTHSYNMNFTNRGVYPKSMLDVSSGLPVRCVQ